VFEEQGDAIMGEVLAIGKNRVLKKEYIQLIQPKQEPSLV